MDGWVCPGVTDIAGSVIHIAEKKDNGTYCKLCRNRLVWGSWFCAWYIDDYTITEEPEI